MLTVRALVSGFTKILCSEFVIRVCAPGSCLALALVFAQGLCLALALVFAQGLCLALALVFVQGLCSGFGNLQYTN
ncbi:unnamed protein product [Gordionus sp. m RMFG-2023]